MEVEKPDTLSIATLKLVKWYYPKMGIELPLNEDSAYAISKELVFTEAHYADEVEDVACMFGDAFDEWMKLRNKDNPNYEYISKLLESISTEPDNSLPIYNKWYYMENKRKIGSIEFYLLS